MLKITYRDKSDKEFLEKLLNENNLDATLEYQLSLEEQKDVLKKYKGPAIGSPILDSFIDLGQHTVAFVLSDEFPILIIKKAVTHVFFTSIIIPTYKKIFSKNKKNILVSNSLCIVTDNYEKSPLKKSIYFMLEGDLNDDQLNHALGSIYGVRNEIVEALNTFEISSDVLRFTYINNKWVLQKTMDLSINYYLDDSITIKAVLGLVKSKQKKNKSFINKIILFFKKEN